ncbi:MAG: hypothetical protein OEZ65_09610 [Gemmatimonadota bacterium]|nr:hypothetical protein [Gemmatimonadota bacterium]MDH5759832.1 hypothetical protein [Gemmatimonadota bacterium]
MRTFQMTIRYGGASHRYHTFVVEGADLKEALIAATARIPDAMGSDADLVELRSITPPEERPYLPE